MGAPRSQSFALQGEAAMSMSTPSVPRSQSFPNGDSPDAAGGISEDQKSSNMPAGPPAAQRPHELRELSSEVPREPSWPSEGPTSCRNAEASTPTSWSSEKAAAAASQQTQGSPPGVDTAAWDTTSPNSKAEISPQVGSSKKCTSKNPFWVQPEVPNKKAAQSSSCDGINGLLSGAAALRCLSDVVDAGDRNFEIDIAEEDLTTVHISSWEQRLDWRSFLSEAVAASLARQAFMNFDVEAEPPSYPKPPPSARSGPNSENQRCVAPDGSGWMPG